MCNVMDPADFVVIVSAGSSKMQMVFWVSIKSSFGV